jgi:hypothetical protein
LEKPTEHSATRKQKGSFAGEIGMEIPGAMWLEKALAELTPKLQQLEPGPDA